MQSVKQQYHHGNLRESLIKEASSLIEEVGLEKFGLRQLSRQLGVSHAAVYKHFTDKRALLVAIAIEGYKRLSKEIKTQSGKSGGARHKVKVISVIYYNWFAQNSSEYQVIFGPRLNDDGLYSELEDAIELIFSLIDEAFLDSGMTKEHSREHTVSLVTMLHGYCDMVRLKRIRVANIKAGELYLLKNIEPFLKSLAC